MAYGKKYMLSLISDRGNDYRVEILQQGYTGAAVNKAFGAVPTLSIEEGDGRIKGSSLAFSIQADAEGELSGLYTTNNKEYKVLLYRNSTLYWQGYLLPELYSENYVDPPFDVAVTATDQLATLKDVEYQGEDVLTSLLDIIKGILLNTKVDIPCTIHMQLSSAQGALLQNSYISAANYNGQSCYDVLNAILLSCNSSIMQMGNRWLIASLTDASTVYTTGGVSEDIPFTTIGQMGKADVCPDGSLVMVNSPAFKGATVEYNHTLRKSMLLNPECINKNNWEYNNVSDLYPGTTELIGGVYKNSFWSLYQQCVQNNNTLQLWQDISLKLDTHNTYELSFKTMFYAEAEMLLLYVAYTSDYGTTWYLTAEGWKTEFDASKAASYIQITGQSKGYGVSIIEMSDKTKYETTTVRFMLPDVQGKLKVGFINNAPEDSDGSAYQIHAIAVTDVFLTIATISGKTSTTLVEKNASTSQEEIAITYGEAIESTNADKLELSYLRDADGQKIGSIVLSGREYKSYYLAMVQDFSRYYGVKKMQLQGALMGVDVLTYLYKDVFSGKVCRLLSGQYNLLEDSISVNLEEVPTAFVDYNLVVYAKENVSKNNTTTAGGAVAVGGGDSHIGVQADGDAYVKNDRPLLGKESRFENVALPMAEPERVVERTYIYSSEPSRYPSVNLTAMSDTMVTLQSGLTDVSRRVTDLEKLFYYDAEHDAVRTSMSLIIDKWITFGGIGIGQGTVTGATELDGLNDVQITRPEGGQVLMYDEDLGLWVNKAGGGVSGDYLPLSGGTMTGSLHLGDLNSSTYLDVAVLRNGMSAYMGIQGTQGAIFGHVGSNGDSKGLIIDSSGLIYDDNNTQYNLLHSGNIGTYNNGYIWSSNISPFDYHLNGTYIYAGGAIANNWPKDWGILINNGNGTGGVKNQFYAATDGTLYWRIKYDDTSRGWYELIHSGNIGSYITGGGTACLPLTGGTLTGNHNVLTIDGRDNSYILFRLYSVAKASVGYYNNFAFVANENTYARIGIANDGTPQYWPHYNGSAKYTLYHSGNLAEGGVISGTIRIAPHTGNYSEGIRIQPNGEWTAILLGGTDMTASGEGTTARSWGIFNNDGKFYINRNGSNQKTGVQLCNVNDCWGIGTSSPEYTLSIYDVSNRSNCVHIITSNTSGETSVLYQSDFQNVAWAAGISCGYSNEDIFSFYSVTAGSWAAYITTQGNFVAKGSLTFKMASDRRLKDNIKPLTIRDTMRVLHRLKPVSFEWNEIAFSLDNTKEGLCDGFLADEYEKLIPNSGRAIWEKYRAIDYTRAIPYLAKGWQIHESELDKMRKKVKTMERRIEHLENILVEHNIMVA